MSKHTNMQVDDLIAEAGGIQAMADKLGVDRASVYDWKRNKLIPASRVAQIHAAIGIDLEALLSLTKQASAQSQAAA